LTTKANGVIREVSCRVQLRQFTCNVAPLSIGTINEFVQAFPISAKDEEVGEIPVAFVVKKAGTVLSPKDVIARLRCETGSFYKTDMSSMIFEFILLLQLTLSFYGRLFHTRRFGKLSSLTRYRDLQLERSSEGNSEIT
jgi:hypothetical protein